jgi:hypothetical protein
VSQALELFGALPPTMRNERTYASMMAALAPVGGGGHTPVEHRSNTGQSRDRRPPPPTPHPTVAAAFAAPLDAAVADGP